MSGEGEDAERLENYEYFSKLSFYDIFDVVLKNDTVFSVRLESPEKFIDNISINLDSAELLFRDENFARWLPDYPRPKVTISLPRLDDQLLAKSPIKLTTSDTLRINSLNLVFLGKTGEFDLTMDVNSFYMVNGSDNYAFYYFRGFAKTAKFWPRGSSQIDASMLTTQDCFIYNNSIGDCFVNASHKIEARLNTAGNVYYSGDPSEIIISEESGSGKLIRDDK